MLLFIFKRLFSGAVTIWFIATATFFAMHAVPGDPLVREKAMSPQVRAQLEARYGLDQPLITQYRLFIGNMLKGDFGISFTQENRRVNDIIREHFPISAILGIAALLIAVTGAVAAGSIAAYHRNRWPDHLVMAMVIAAISVPSFVIAALAQLAIVNLNKMAGTAVPVAGWGSVAQVWIPALVLGLGTMAYLSRLMRASMLEVISADYVTAAKAKGVRAWPLFWRHQLRNAVLPVITELGPTIAAITTGGFVVELVFAIPGLGRYFVQAVQQLDYTVIMGTTVFYGAFLVLVVVIVDISYGIIDPRIRLYGGRQ